MDRKPLIEIDLGTNGGNLAFYEPSEIIKWAEHERQAWEFVQSYGSPDNFISDYWNRFDSKCSAIISHAQILTKSKETPPNEKYLGELRNHFEPFVSGSLIFSGSARGIFLQDLKGKDKREKEAAAGALWYFQQRGGQARVTRDSLRGLTEAVFFEHGIKGAGVAERKIFDDLSARLRDTENQYRTSLDEQKNSSDKFSEAAAGLLSGQKLTHEQLVTGQTTTFESLLNATKSKLEIFEQIYNQKLATSAPVTYWQRKRVAHNLFSVVMAVSIGLTFWFGGLQLADIVKLFLKDAVPKPSEIAIVIISGTLLIWLLRILVRLFLSQIHLAQVAAERVVMMQAYLSLLKEQASLQERDRSLIIEMLFRPSATGIVKDDATPPGLAEIISRLTSK